VILLLPLLKNNNIIHIQNLKNMKTKYIIIAMLLAICSTALIFTSCTKGDNMPGHNYLRLSHGVINISGKGSQTKFSVESDLRWSLKFSPVAVPWAEIDKSNGNGNTIVTITAIQSALPNGAVRSVDIVATAENNLSLPPIRLMLLQHDTTSKK
jgi:hypothetical protein